MDNVVPIHNLFLSWDEAEFLANRVANQIIKPDIRRRLLLVKIWHENVDAKELPLEIIVMIGKYLVLYYYKCVKCKEDKSVVDFGDRPFCSKECEPKYSTRIIGKATNSASPNETITLLQRH